MKIKYNKLVRDKIPGIIQKTGKEFQIAYYDEDEYKEALLEKLIEEANEVRNAPSDRLIIEMADLLEVYETIISANNISNDHLINLKNKRHKERGGFINKIKLLWVDDQ